MVHDGAVASLCRESDGGEAARACDLLPPPRPLDPVGVLGHLAERPAPDRTCFAGVGRRVPSPPARTPFTLDRLRDALDRVPSGAALALSGGLDSSLLIALRPMPAYVLSTPWPDYDELAAARAACPDVRVVRATERDFVEAVPEAVRLAEAPFYNLHPVSKLLLGRAVARDGFRALVTGDGADQAFTHEPAWDYLPLVQQIVEGAGLAWHAPYLRLGVPRDPEKRALRDAARGLVPEAIRLAPKRARLAPPMDLSRYWPPKRLPPYVRVRPTTERNRVKLVTLSLLIETCAASPG
jgi:asparagine synthetase B (glutamine-hydrolysing)